MTDRYVDRNKIFDRRCVDCNVRIIPGWKRCTNCDAISGATLRRKAWDKKKQLIIKELENGKKGLAIAKRFKVSEALVSKLKNKHNK